MWSIFGIKVQGAVSQLQFFYWLSRFIFSKETSFRLTWNPWRWLCWNLLQLDKQLRAEKKIVQKNMIDGRGWCNFVSMSANFLLIGRKRQHENWWVAIFNRSRCHFQRVALRHLDNSSHDISSRKEQRGQESHSILHVWQALTLFLRYIDQMEEYNMWNADKLVRTHQSFQFELESLILGGIDVGQLMRVALVDDSEWSVHSVLYYKHSNTRSKQRFFADQFKTRRDHSVHKPVPFPELIVNFDETASAVPCMGIRLMRLIPGPTAVREVFIVRGAFIHGNGTMTEPNSYFTFPSSMHRTKKKNIALAQQRYARSGTLMWQEFFFFTAQTQEILFK